MERKRVHNEEETIEMVAEYLRKTTDRAAEDQFQKGLLPLPFCDWCGEPLDSEDYDQLGVHRGCASCREERSRRYE